MFSARGEVASNFEDAPRDVTTTHQSWPELTDVLDRNEANQEGNGEQPEDSECPSKTRT
jgi:hypothetical protein